MFSLSGTIRNAFNHELTLLAKARHPNIVQFVGAVTQNLPMMIVVEHNPKVSKHSYLFPLHFLPANRIRNCSNIVIIFRVI